MQFISSLIVNYKTINLILLMPSYCIVRRLLTYLSEADLWYNRDLICGPQVCFLSFRFPPRRDSRFEKKKKIKLIVSHLVLCSFWVQDRMKFAWWPKRNTRPATKRCDLKQFCYEFVFEALADKWIRKP